MTGRGAGPRRREPVWIYGTHPVLAALANPRRDCRRLLVTDEAHSSSAAALERAAAGRPALRPEPASRRDINALLPLGAVHQGLALAAMPLPGTSLEALCAAPGPALIVALDQVTDPHNVGAILRSAALFGAAGVIVTERHAPRETGALAKAAAGALDQVPLVRVTNLVRALMRLKEAGVWCLGLDGAAERPLAGARPAGRSGERIGLVLGAEGHGLRRLTRETCDALARIPTPERPGDERQGGFAVDSLNVSNAAAIALYELRRAGTPGGHGG